MSSPENTREPNALGSASWTAEPAESTSLVRTGVDGGIAVSPDMENGLGRPNLKAPADDGAGM